MASAPKSAKLLQFVALLIVFFLLCVFIQPSESNYLWRFPPLLKEIPRLINDFVRGLMGSCPTELALFGLIRV